jgi:flagellin-like hook-associated protein FlgL
MFIGMQSSFMPSTLAHNLNDSVSRMQKMHRHLQTGERLIESSDNPGDFAVKAKLNMRRANSELMGANIQNTVSFLQVQQGMLETVGTVLQRMAELKTQEDTIFATDDVNDMYNYEFKELQGQLSEISQSKFNGISLFSDQMPKVLFGDSIGTAPLKPETHENQTDNEMNVTRWGMYRALSDNIESGDKFPSKFGENPSRDVLAFALSDETYGGSYADDADENGAYISKDLDDWKDMIGERNIDGKIAVINVQSGGWGTPSDEAAMIPRNGYVPEFAKIYGGYPRDIDSQYAPKPPTAQAAVSLGLSVLKDAFFKETNNGEDLPATLGVFIDDTGSVVYKEVDDGANAFMDWIRTNYPSIAVSSRTGGQWSNGIYSASSERWIEQSRIALSDMMDNDPDIKDAIPDGTLDNEKSGVKGLLDEVYDLEDFDSSEFLNFIEKLTEAMAVNGAETSRATSELEELNTRQLGLEKSMENIDGLDFSLAMTRYTAAQVETQFRAQLVSKAEDLHVRIADLLE